MNIPNFVDMKIIDDNGYFTPEWKIIMQQLLTELQDKAGQEGLVAPTQTNVDVLKIEANKEQIPDTTTITGFNSIYTCQFGTLLYDSTNNTLLVALSNAGVPTFHTIVTL